MDDFDRPDYLTPRRIAVVYLAFGFAALVFSDVALPRLVSGRVLRQYQLLKGALEVVVTAGLVYVLVSYGQRSLRSANDRLERNDEVLQVLLRLVRHNIRNDMNVVQGHAETASSSAECTAVEESCSAILETTDELLRRTETVNELREMLEGTTERRTFDLSDLVGDVAAETHRSVERDLRTTTDGVDAVEVTANSLLPFALGEIVDNAVRYNEDGTPRVEFATDVDGETAHLHVRDDGPGIPEGELEVLAEREESPLVHSSGLGLWFVYWVVADSGGAVSVHVRESGGTEVTLSLPLASADVPLAHADLPAPVNLLGAD